jgi:dTDP-4-dehydrorhamnose reductase
MRGILASRAAGADDLIKPDQLHMTVPMHVCTGKVLAEAIAAVIARPERLTGILHLAGTDAISMLDWAKVIQQVWNLHGPRISNGPGREGEAPRPRLGGLSVKRAKSLGLPLYGLREGLVAYHNAGGWGDA